MRELTVAQDISSRDDADNFVCRLDDDGFILRVNVDDTTFNRLLDW